LAAEHVRRVTLEFVNSNVGTGLIGLIGVVLGLVLDRWVRRWGAVRCKIDWQVARGAGSVNSPGGLQVDERQLKFTFRNEKDLPVTVLKMEGVFYKGSKPLEEWARPDVKIFDERRETSVGSLVNLPSHKAVSRTISLAPERNNPFKRRMLEEADEAEFVAAIIGARDKREQLTPPW
jgi:hypothetical protein